MTPCPVCRCEWTREPTRCACGYDFVSADPHTAIRALEIENQRSTSRALLGIAVLGSSLLTLALTAVFPSVMLVMPLVLTIQILLGVGFIGSGVRMRIGTQRQLMRARSLVRPLPAARLLVRDVNAGP